ncbi:MAG: type II toxin-antitoxin system YafQ family toxin [Candidatus Liptonbacteria bacterium]|nr:type II toxin-antitoxin system YafQ family toxin [Candidatus Liptonbacteria bacterium]
MKLVTSSRFERSLRQFLRKHPDLKKELAGKLELLRRDPANPSLRLHALSGKLRGCFAFAVSYEYRIVVELKGSEVHLLAVGTHDEAY